MHLLLYKMVEQHISSLLTENKAAVQKQSKNRSCGCALALHSCVILFSVHQTSLILPDCLRLCSTRHTCHRRFDNNEAVKIYPSH